MTSAVTSTTTTITTTTSKLLIQPTIILFGDSLTQMAFGENGKVGWASLLSSAYQRRADVLNRGYYGYNSRQCLDLVPKVFGHSDNGILFSTILIGTNDAALPSYPTHVPLKEYSENLEKIITTIRERTTRVGSSPKENDNYNYVCIEKGKTMTDVPIIVLTPPPIDIELYKAYEKLEIADRTNDDARKYGEEAKRVSLKNKCWSSIRGSC